MYREGISGRLPSPPHPGSCLEISDRARRDGSIPTVFPGTRPYRYCRDSRETGIEEAHFVRRERSFRERKVGRGGRREPPGKGNRIARKWRSDRGEDKGSLVARLFVLFGARLPCQGPGRHARGPCAHQGTRREGVFGDREVSLEDPRRRRREGIARQATGPGQEIAVSSGRSGVYRFLKGEREWK
jgi:hypothetical protein